MYVEAAGWLYVAVAVDVELGHGLAELVGCKAHAEARSELPQVVLG